MLCTFISDVIGAKVEFVQALCKTWIWSRERLVENGAHRVLIFYESIGKILCALASNSIPLKVEFGQCLYEM
jgi:hypothetical protein